MLDEPSLGLAPMMVREILRIVASLRELGVSILLVEQNARAALETADYGYVLETGEITHQGPAAALAQRPARGRDLSRRFGLMAVPAPYDGVVLAAPVTVPYVRYSIRSAHWFLGRALAALLDGAKIPKARIDGLAVASFTLAPDTAVGLDPASRAVAALARPCADGRRVRRCLAPARGARGAGGDAEIVACIAGDTNHVDTFRRNTANFSQFARDAVYPYGAGGPNASFAFLTAYYMRTYGATREDFGKLCVAQRSNALKNPLALFKKPLTLDEYLDARPIADPLRLFDCVMPCAGAEGFLVMQRGPRRTLGLRYARLLGTIERHNAFADDPVQYRGGWAIDRDDLYAQAGVGPADIDFVAGLRRLSGDHVLQIEDLGFCGKGGAGLRPRQHLRRGRQLPVQHLRRPVFGRPGRRGRRHLGMVEAIRQLTGEPLARQVPDARHGLVSGFGMINYDRGLCSGAAILAAA